MAKRCLLTLDPLTELDRANDVLDRRDLRWEHLNSQLRECAMPYMKTDPVPGVSVFPSLLLSQPIVSVASEILEF